MNSNELYHYGVLGMHWGVRRYQPYGEGGYTPKKSNAERKAIKEERKAIREERKATAQQKREDVKNRRSLTDEEIKKKIDRLNLEKQLKDLTDKEVNEGRNFVKDILKNSGSKVITSFITGATLYAIKAALSKHIDLKELANAIFNGGPKKK